MTEGSRPGHGGSPSIVVDDYWWYTARARLLEEALGRFVPPNGQVLDVGSADAPSAGWFHERAGHRVSVDIDPRGLDADGVCASLLSLPFASASFDAVAAFDVIEHVDPESVAVRELFRVLRPGGVLVASVPAYQWAWSDHDVANGHHRRYTRARLVDALTAAGFSVERSTYAFTSVFPMFAGERVLRRLRGSRVEGASDIVGVPQVPAALHHMLLALCRLDERLLRARDLPWGSSVLAAARRPA